MISLETIGVLSLVALKDNDLMGELKEMISCDSKGFLIVESSKVCQQNCYSMKVL